MLRVLGSRTTRQRGLSCVLPLPINPQEAQQQRIPQLYMQNGQADSEATSTPKLVLHEPFLAPKLVLITHMKGPIIHAGHGDDHGGL